MTPRSLTSGPRRLAPVLLAAGTLAAAGCGSSGHRATTHTPPAKTSKSSGIEVNKAPQFAAPSASAPVQSGVVQIEYRNITIRPDTVRVRVGSTVRWRNLDPTQHTVTAVGGVQRFASKRLGEGATFSVKLTKPGLIHYECTIHPTTMNGTIEVVR